MKDIKQISQRIKGLREILEISVAEMAEICNMPVSEYEMHEKGERDFTFSFLNKCATKLNIDLAELFTGESAYLQGYVIERKNEGLVVERRKGFNYRLLASRFKNRNIEPYCVTVPYEEQNQDKLIKTSTHDGQEMDFILEGSLKISINGKEEILNAGDTAFYNSALPHGMIATGGSDCKFLAILIKN